MLRLVDDGCIRCMNSEASVPSGEAKGNVAECRGLAEAATLFMPAKEAHHGSCRHKRHTKSRRTFAEMSTRNLYVHCIQSKYMR